MTEKFCKYRPTYPENVCQVVIDYMKKRSEATFDLMLDVGCGGGHSSISFAPYFKAVIAIDADECKINEAKARNSAENITYKVGRAEELDVQDKSVDLVLSACAVHFFKISAFLNEVERVLKPGGCLALLGYLVPVAVPRGFKGDIQTRRGQFMKLTQDLLSSEIRERWVEFQHVADKYQTILETIQWPKKTRVKDLSMKFEWSSEQLTGFFYSLILVASCNSKRYAEVFSLKSQVTTSDLQNHDVISIMMKEMKKLCGVAHIQDEELRFSVTFDLFMLLSEKTEF